MADKKMLGLALKTLGAKSSGAPVPQHVMQSALALKKGGGSQTDRENIFNYWGISKTGAGALRAQTKQQGQNLGILQKYSGYAGQIAQGGYAGMAGAASMTDAAAKDIEALFKNSSFKKNLQTFVGAVVAGKQGRVPTIMGIPIGTMAAGTDEQNAEVAEKQKDALKWLYGVGGKARLAGAYAGAAIKGLQYLKAGWDIGSTAAGVFGGASNVGSITQLGMTKASVLADSQSSTEARQLAIKNYVSAWNRQTGWSTVPGIGPLFGNRADVAAGTTPFERGRLDTKLAVMQDRTNIGAENLRERAKNWYYQNTYSNPATRDLMETWNNWGGGNEEAEAGISATVRSLQSQARQKEAEFYRLSEMRRFKQAAEAKEQANFLVPGTLPNGMTPQDWYQTAYARTLAERKWAISISPRALGRNWN